MKKNIFYPNWKIIILTIMFYIFNTLLILQLVPIFESQTFGAKLVNLIVFPLNFFFEDLLGINSIKVIDYLTWILQFVYDYVIVGIIFYFMKGRDRK